MTKKKAEPLPEPIEEEESVPSEPTEPVTSVIEETPEPTPSPAPIEPVIVSELPTKQVKHRKATVTEQDQQVLTWYNSLSGGQCYTREDAADLLGLTVEELNDSLKRLQATVLGERLGHFSDPEA